MQIAIVDNDEEISIGCEESGFGEELMLSVNVDLATWSPLPDDYIR